MLQRPALSTLLVFSGLVLGGLAADSAVAQQAIAFRDVNVIPMDEERVLADQTVIVSDGRIMSIGAAAETAIPDDAEVVEGDGRYLLPGLAEMHAHVPGSNDPRLVEEVLFLYVANGVTTARGMLGEPSHLELRARLERHDVLGPRLITSGPSLNGDSVASPDEARRMVREQAQAGYDFVKLHPGLTREEFDAAVEAASAAGMELAGHVSGDVGLARALEAGQATIDHLDGYVQYLVPQEAAADVEAGFFGLGLADRVDVGRIAEAAEATREAGVWNVPTLTLIEHVSAPSPSAEELAARPEMAYVSPATRQQWAEAKAQVMASPGYTEDKANRLVDVRRRLVGALHEAGAGLLLGSDAPQIFNVPGFSIHHELALVVDSGLTPFEALRTGTANPARFLGAEDEFGVVAPGRAADLMLVDGDPLADIDALRRPAGVMVRGRWLDRAALDARLAEIADRYR